MQNDNLQTSIKIGASWLATGLAWADSNFPRLLLTLSILYTGLQVWILVRDKIIYRERKE